MLAKYVELECTIWDERKINPSKTILMNSSRRNNMKRYYQNVKLPKLITEGNMFYC
jgi:hypothetical protein